MKLSRQTAFIKSIRSRAFASLLCLAAILAYSPVHELSGFTRAALSTAAIAPTPIFFAGAPTCADLNASTNSSFAHIQSDFGFRIIDQFLVQGPFTFTDGPGWMVTGGGQQDPANSIQTVFQPIEIIDFTSTKGITAVIMVGRSGGSFVYPYPVTSFGDTGLTIPNQNSFIGSAEFCYQIPATVTIIKEVTTLDGGTASTTQFPFTATNLSSSNFSLVDNNAFPADRFVQSNIYSIGASNSITVTEGLVSGWTLGDLECVETAGGGFPNIQNSTEDFANRRATIILEQGESVVCTFSNLQIVPTAAPASISGRVATADGRGIGGARINVVNTSTGGTVDVITNPFGYYTVGDLRVGDIYVATVSHKRYSFVNSSRTITLNEDVADADFEAAP